LNIVISQQVARHAAKKLGVGSNKLRLFFEVGERERDGVVALVSLPL